MSWTYWVIIRAPETCCVNISGFQADTSLRYKWSDKLRTNWLMPSLSLCKKPGIYIYLIWPHWLTVLSPDICVMDNPALWLAESDPGLASDWLMGDKIEVTAVIIPCPHHGIPNEQNRIKELKYSWENTCAGSISVLNVASWHQLWKLSHFSKTFKLCSRTALFCKCKNLIYAIRVDK